MGWDPARGSGPQMGAQSFQTHSEEVRMLTAEPKGEKSEFRSLGGCHVREEILL